MKYLFDIIPYQAEFKKPAKTSRNTFLHRDVNFIRLIDANKQSRIGWGECAPLSMLSKDDLQNYSEELSHVLSNFALKGVLEPSLGFKYPSIAFGIETALQDLLNGSNRVVFPESLPYFPIPINGLVWMDDPESMILQAFSLVEEGFNCIKFKVGALDFDQECRLLEKFREKHNDNSIMLRLDANGAFHPMEAKEQLKELKKFGIHSIEQPLRQGQWDDMAKLISEKIVAIALDEELIGANSEEDMQAMFKYIRPDYIVLKPSLHGGFAVCRKWIREADAHKTGYWITSALETNIGLNAIAQFAAPLAKGVHQGLGTGTLFKNNVSGPLKVSGGFLHLKKDTEWDFSIFDIRK